MMLWSGLSSNSDASLVGEIGKRGFVSMHGHLLRAVHHSLDWFACLGCQPGVSSVSEGLLCQEIAIASFVIERCCGAWQQA